MVDNDPNNEEYKLDDLDFLASEPEVQLQPEEDHVALSSEGDTPSHAKVMPWENPTVRKGAIVVGGLILLILCYKMIHAFVAGPAKQNEIMPVAVQQKSFEQHPLQQASANFAGGNENSMSKKLTSLEQEQNNMNSTLQTVNNQVASVNSSVSDISSKMTALSANLAALSEKLDAQTQEIDRLTALNKQHRIAVKHASMRQHGVANAVPNYAIQAIIPGRAWLIASNGSSMTVRAGSSISGYGVVKLIDAERGRVLTSSGRVIRFSQVDS